MVRIINGEIVSDDDPRVKGLQRRSGTGVGGSGAASGSQPRAGYGRVASLLDPPSTPSDGSRGGRNTSRGYDGPPRDEGQEQRPGPLDKFAEMIGVDGRFVTIPGMLGMQEKKLPLIYVIILVVAVLLGGWKAAAIILFAYVLINQKGQSR